MPKLLTYLILSLSWLALGFDSANAELLSKERLAKCEMHAVGIYAPRDHNKDDRVFVEVTASKRPIVLVLSAYYETQWNLKVAEDVDIRQIIVPGYFQQEVVGAPDGVPIETITWFNEDKKQQRKDFFFAYALQTQRGRELRSRLLDLTGLSLMTFQGQNEARNLTIDGNLGSLAGDMVGEPLTRIEKQTIELAMQIQSGQNPENKKALLEKLLRQSFDLQTTDFQSRINGAKKSVALLEKQFENRNQNSDVIIAKRLEALIEGAAAGDAEDPKLAAERLASEGWELWREQEFSSANVKFEKAFKLDPSSSTARNGLGWSQVHLQRYRAATQTFRDLLADDPKHGAAGNGLGVSLMAVGDNAAAKEQFLKAISDAIESLGEEQAAKDRLSAWFGLVQSLQELKQYDEARRWADRYLAHNDDENMERLRDAIPNAKSP